MRRELLLVGLASALAISIGAPAQIAITLEDGGVAFPDGSVQLSSATGAPSEVPTTGQRMCNDPSGSTSNEIPCTGTGQDGELRTGVKWPFPRFTKNGDGTVTDHLTGLVWLEDLNCLAFASGSGLTWLDAVAKANALYDGCPDCGAGGAGDCGLEDGSVQGDLATPERQGVPGPRSLRIQQRGATRYRGHRTVEQRGSLHQLRGRTLVPLVLDNALQRHESRHHLGPGSVSWTVGSAKANLRWFWAVRNPSDSPSGQVAVSIDGGIEFPDGSIQSTSAGGPPSPPARTGQSTVYATGDDGDLREGLPWPSPRLTDHGDGTVTDELTGLVWLEDANCFGDQTWANALAKAADLYDGCPSCGGSNGDRGLAAGSQEGDWRLATFTDFMSLIAFGFNPAIPNAAGTGPWTWDDPFLGLRTDKFYWTSTNYANDPTQAWAIHAVNGNSGGGAKNQLQPVWLVRGGR
jgi:hypothetical protein